MQQDDNTRKLYDALTADNYDLGDYEKFASDISKPDNLRKLYDTMVADNYALEDYDKFSSRFNTHQPKPQAAQPKEKSVMSEAAVASMPQGHSSQGATVPAQQTQTQQAAQAKPILFSVGNKTYDFTPKLGSNLQPKDINIGIDKSLSDMWSPTQAEDARERYKQEHGVDIMDEIPAAFRRAREKEQGGVPDSEMLAAWLNTSKEEKERLYAEGAKEYENRMKYYTSTYPQEEQRQRLNAEYKAGTLGGSSAAGRTQAYKAMTMHNEAAAPWVEADKKRWSTQDAKAFREETISETMHDPYATVPESYREYATKAWGKKGSEDAYFTAWMNLSNKERKDWLHRDQVKALFDGEGVQRIQDIRTRADEKAPGFWRRTAEARKEHPWMGSEFSMSEGMYRDATDINQQTVRAIDKAEEMKQAYKNHQGDENFFVGAFKGLKDGITDVDTWTGAYMLGEMTLLSSIVDKMNKGEKLTQDEEDYFEAQAYKMAVEAALADDLGWGYGSGKTTAVSIPMMLQMIATGGGGLATKGVDKVAAKIGERAVKGYGKTILKRMLMKGVGKGGTRALTLASRVPLAFADGAVQTTIWQSDKVVADAVRRSTGTKELAKKAGEMFGIEIEGKEAEDFGKALSKSFALYAAENGTEFLGNAFLDPLGDWMGKGIKKVVKGTKVYDDFAQVIASARRTGAGAALYDVTTMGDSPFIKELMGKSQWSGLLGEGVEEKINEGINILMGEAESEDFFDLEKNAQMLLGLSWTSLAFGVANGYSRTRAYAKIKKELDSAEKIGTLAFTAKEGEQLQETWEDFKGRIDQMSYPQLKHALSELSAEWRAAESGTISRDRAEAQLRYIMGRGQLLGFAAADSQAEMQNPFTEEQQEIDEATGEGINADEQTQKTITEERNIAEQALFDQIGEDVDEFVARYGETSDQQLQGIRTDESLSDEVRDIAENYVVTNAKFNGVVEAAEAEIEQAEQAAQREVETNANMDKEQVVRVTVDRVGEDGMTMEPTGAYVVQGDALGEDGVYDGSTVLQIRYADGTTEQVSASNVKVESVHPLQEMIDAAREGARMETINAVSTRMQNSVPTGADTVMQPGQRVTLEDGRAGVVETFDGVQMYQIKMDDGSNVVAPASVLRDEAAAQSAAQITAQAQENVKHSIAGRRGKRMSRQARMQQQSQSPTLADVRAQRQDVTAEQTSAQTATEQIPVSETGARAYEQAEPSLAWQSLVEQSGGDAQIAESALMSTIRQKEDALRQLESEAVAAGNSIEETIAAQTQHKARIEAAKADLAKWQAIAKVNQDAKAEAEQAKKAKALQESNKKAATESNAQIDVNKVAEETGADAKEVKRLVDLCSALGVKVQFEGYTTTDGTSQGHLTNASVDTGSRTITISKLQMAKGTGIHFILGHELTHQIKADGNKELWGKYLESVVNAVGIEAFQAKLASMSMTYMQAGAYQNMTMEEFREAMQEEVCADFAGEAVFSPGNVKKFLGIEPTLIEKITGKIQEMFDTIRKKIYGFSMPQDIAYAAEQWQQLAEGKELTGEADGRERHSITNKNNRLDEHTNEEKIVSLQTKTREYEHDQVARLSGEGDAISTLYRTTSPDSGTDNRAAEETRPSGAQKESLLRSLVRRAKENETWIEDIRPLVGRFISSAGEHEVFFSRKGDTVIKLNDFEYLPENSTDFASFINRIESFNELFPDVAVTVVGYTYNSEGKVSVVLEQPVVDAEREATEAEIDAFMEDHDFYMDMSGEYTDGRYVVYDLKPNNVYVDKSGSLRFFDALVFDESRAGSMLTIPHDIKKRKKFVAPYQEDPTAEPRYSLVGTTGARALDKAEGTTVRMDNMDVAEEMEAAGKDAETIWLATGWERGADGKWRYEVLDGQFNVIGELHPERRRLSDEEKAELDGAFIELMDAFEKGVLAMGENESASASMADIYAAGGMERSKAEHLSALEEKENALKRTPKFVDDYLENSQLFDAYPELREIKVEEGNSLLGLVGTMGSYNPQAKVITLNDLSQDTLLHEIQHVIQHIEGFATGGSVKTIQAARKKNNQIRNTVESLLRSLGMDQWFKEVDPNTIAQHLVAGRNFNLGYAFSETLSESTGRLLRDKLDEANRVIAENNRVSGNKSVLEPKENYRRLAGETEARNVQSRLNMSPEERRQTRPSKSEDVARKEQIVIYSEVSDKDGAELEETANATRYSIVVDPQLIAELEASPKRKGYRNVVQREDGLFEAPMGNSLRGNGITMENTPFAMGQWEQSEEHPELVYGDNKITLVKPDGKTVADVNYNPYIHNRLNTLNAQFKQAWERPDLVYVETEVPVTDLEGGYMAEHAHLSTGVHQWSNGALMLSRYDKPVRIVPWDEVAIPWIEKYKKSGVHFDIVPPALRPILAEAGVEIKAPHNGMGENCIKAYEEWKAQQGVKYSDIKPIGQGYFGNIYDQFKGKPKEAIEFLMQIKDGEAIGALTHPEIGEIDLVWGKEGTGKSDGFGLAKLVKFHPEVLENLQGILDGMHIVTRNSNRVNLESDTHKASVRLTWDNQRKNWLLTAFEKKNSVSDNTTDTGETSLRGKQNDTATLQDTVFNSKDTQSVSTEQTDKKEISEKSAESNVEVTNEEVKPTDNVGTFDAENADIRYSMPGHSVASRIYSHPFTGTWQKFLQRAPKGVLKPGYGIIDESRLPEFEDWYRMLVPEAEEYKEFVSWFLEGATATEKKHVQSVMDGVDKIVDDYRRLAEGDNSVLSLENNARFSITPDIFVANERFNAELDEYIKKGTKANFVFHIGQPLGVMKLFFPELPIVMRPRVINKASNTKHDVDATSLYNLPQYIAEPIFVFQREDGAIGILTEMMDNNGKNVCVAVELNKKIQDGGTYLNVNDIRSIHGRDVKNIVLPIIHNNTLKYADKKKALDWFSSASSIYQQEITSQELSDATKIVQDFQNPPLPEDESSQNIENAKSGEQKYSLPARPATPKRNEGEGIMAYAERVARVLEAQRAWDVANKTATDIDRQMKDSEEYRRILAQKEPQTIEEAASLALAGGKLLWNDHVDGTKVSKGAKSMMGWGEDERQRFFAMFASKENGGVSVEQMGEAVMDICSQYNIPVDETDAMAGTNAVLEVLQSAQRPSDITGYIEHNRIEQVRRMIEEEQELLASERNRAYMDMYGMTYDDFVEIASTIDAEDEQERSDDKNVIAWLYGQSQRQQERISNAQAELEQLKRNGVPKTQYDAAYRALEQMKAKVKRTQEMLDEATKELRTAKGLVTRQRKANMRYKAKKGQWKQVFQELRKAINGKNIRSIDKNTLNEIMRAVGSADLSGMARFFGEAGMVEDIILGVNMRATQDRIDKLLATKTTALNDKGIATGKSVDASVQAILANVRKTLEGILHHDIENQIHDLRSQNWHIRHNAVGNLSQEQQEQVDANKAKIEELKAELGKELATSTATTEQAVNEQIENLTEQIDKGLRTEEESAELMTTLALKRQMVAIHTSYQDTATVEALLRRKQSELRTNWVALHDGNTPQDKREEYRQKRKALQEQIAGLEAQVREGRQATLDAMQSFADSLEETITTGRANLKGKVQEQLQRRKEFVAKAIHDVNASGKQMQSVNEADKQENDKLPWYKRMFSPALRTFDYMLQKIATRTYGKDSWLYRQFMLGENGVMAAHDEYLRGMQTAARTLEDKAMEIFGKPYQDVMAESNRKKDIGIEILRDAEDYEPSYIPLKLTKGQATYIYMLWRMRDGFSKLATQGFTEEIMQRIEEYIGPDYIQWADWMQMEYLPMMREKYNARYREIYDTNMAAIDNYVPIRIHGQAIRKEVDLTDATASMPGMQKKNGALIQRTVNVNPIDISNNIFELIGQHIDEMEEFYAYAPVRRDLQYILSSPAFRNLLNTQEPGTFQSLLEAARIATKTNQQPESAALKAFNDFMNKTQKGLVSGNIAYRNMTAIKQVLSAPAFIGYSQSPVYLGILAKNMLGGYLRNMPTMAFPLIPGIGHWAQKMIVEETAKGMPYIDKFLGESFRWCMREFPDFRERVTRGSAGDIRLEEKGFSKLLDKYTAIGMSANVFIDAVTVSIGLKSIYDYEMEKAGKRISKMAEEMQMDEQWAEEEMRKASNAAKIQATLFANQTQQSSNPALLSPMQVSKNFMERSLTLYKNSSLGLMRAGIGGMRNLLRYMKGKKARRRMTEEYTRMFMQEGFAENEAKKRAISYINSEARKGAFVALLEGFAMNVIWNLGSKGLLGFMTGGGDDDDKERTIGEMVWDGTKFVINNTFGSAIPFVNDALEGRLPAIGLTTSEAEKAWKDTKKQLDENGISLAFALTGMRYAAKFGGIDVETWANSMDGYYRLVADTGNNDERLLALMLVLNSPRSNRMAVARELYKGASEEEFQKAIELAGRYNRPAWAYGREMTDKVKSDMINWYIEDNMTPQEAERAKEVRKWKARIEAAKTIDEARALYDEAPDMAIKEMVQQRMNEIANPTQEKTFEEKVESKEKDIYAMEDEQYKYYQEVCEGTDVAEDIALREKIKQYAPAWNEYVASPERSKVMERRGSEILKYRMLSKYRSNINKAKAILDRNKDKSQLGRIRKMRKEALAM